MKRKTFIILFCALILMICGTGAVYAEEHNMIYAYINEDVITIKPAENSSASAFTDLLRSGDVTVVMHDYGNFEKVGSIGATLPRNDEPITTEPGDVILYLGTEITIYYDVNQWNFTRLGKVQNVSREELRTFLRAGGENVSVRFSLTPPASLSAAAEDASVVYFTSDITAEGLVKIYEALNRTPSGKVAVKISTGEPPASNYLRPELIGDLVRLLDGTIVECNTAYGGARASAAMHKQVAADHGFTAIAPFDLLDEEGEVEWPVTGGVRLDRAIVGSHAENYSDWVILSHFKGHQMAGYGGAIKNVAIAEPISW